MYRVKGDQSKNAKIIKKVNNPPSLHLNFNVMPSNITFLMIFAGFDPSPLIQWINCIFSINICCFIVMCNVSLCNYKVCLSKPDAKSAVCGCFVVCALSLTTVTLTKRMDRSRCRLRCGLPGGSREQSIGWGPW